MGYGGDNIERGKENRIFYFERVSLESSGCVRGCFGRRVIVFFFVV